MRVRLLHIDGGHFYAGAVLADGVCTAAAPILRYMVDWREWDILMYCRRKRWGCAYWTPGRDLSDIL